MSIKSIERRLCSSFYDMAWLNLSAGIENLPEIAPDEAGFGTLSESFRKQFLAEGRALTEALASGDQEEVSAADLCKEIRYGRDNAGLTDSAYDHEQSEQQQ